MADKRLCTASRMIAVKTLHYRVRVILKVVNKPSKILSAPSSCFSSIDAQKHISDEPNLQNVLKVSSPNPYAVCVIISFTGVLYFHRFLWLTYFAIKNASPPFLLLRPCRAGYIACRLHELRFLIYFTLTCTRYCSL